MATVVVLLALSPQTMAQGSKAICRSSSTAHPKRGAHVCVNSGRKRKAHARPKAKARGHHAKGKAHVRLKAKAKGHHAKHAVGKKKSKKTVNAPPPTVTIETAAACEDGTAPIQAGDGSFSCGDGSEPTCDDGLNLTFNSDGSTPLCGGGSNGPAGENEPVCEDGTAPVLDGDSSISCADGSDPTCADGAEVAFSSDGSTLLCGVGSNGPPDPNEPG
jgi:hypothetical protein